MNRATSGQRPGRADACQLVTIVKRDALLDLLDGSVYQLNRFHPMAALIRGGLIQGTSRRAQMAERSAHMGLRFGLREAGR